MRLLTNLLLVSMALAPLLSGCKQEHTSAYYMEHPKVLKQAFDRCQSATDPVLKQSMQCDVVLSAAAKFSAIEDEQRQDPEKFGQRIMDVEATSVKDKLALQAAEADLASLKVSQRASAADIKAAQAKIAVEQNAYNEHHEEMRVLLAVIGINSPE